MATPYEQEYVPVFIEDLEMLYVLDNGKPRSLVELLRTLSAEEITLPISTTKLISGTDTQGANQHYSVLASPQKLCCYTILGRRIYLPC